MKFRALVNSTEDPRRVLIEGPATLRLPEGHAVRAAFMTRGFIAVRAAIDRSVVSRVLESAVMLVHRCGVAIERAGTSADLNYTVVTGDHIRAENGFLADLYWSDEMVAWLRSLTGAPAVHASRHLRSAININCLNRAGQQYPWHRDAVPFTVVLFLTSAAPGAGGELLIHTADAENVAIRPHAGDLIVMDGSRCPHAVAALAVDAVRLTVPMVYPAFDIERPDGLDDYLYSQTAAREA